MEQDEELEIVGVKEAHEVGPQEMGVADKAGQKTGGGWKPAGTGPGGCACGQMPAAPVPQGVPQDLLLILQAMARV